MDAQTAGSESGLLKSLRGHARFFDRKIGLRKIGVIISLTMITIAVIVLYRILRNIDPDALIDAIDATDWRTLIIAGAVRRRRLPDADLLRSLCAAHDRPARSAVSDRRAGRFHQLFGRPQCRRQRVLRRRGALSHLFELGPVRHRGHQDLLRLRPDVLARQRHRARARRAVVAAGSARDRSIAAVVQSHHGASSSLLFWSLISPGSGSSRGSSAATAGR